MKPERRLIVGLLSLLTTSTISAADPVHEAAMNGDVAKVTSFLDKDPAAANVHDADDHQCTPLHDAAIFGKVEVVKLLLARGADVNSKDDEGSTPLFKSAGAKGDAVRVAEALIVKGAKVDAKNKFGKTPLHDAAMVSNTALASFLIAKGAKVDASDNEGWTPLYEAAMFNKKSEMSKLLVEKKADVNTKSRIGWTPLDAAVSSGHDDVAEYLRANGGRSGR